MFRQTHNADRPQFLATLRPILAYVFRTITNTFIGRHIIQRGFISGLRGQRTGIGSDWAAPLWPAATALVHKAETRFAPSSQNRKAICGLMCSDLKCPLTPDERLVLVLRDAERLPLTAVAQFFSCSHTVTRLHLANARMKFPNGARFMTHLDHKTNSAADVRQQESDHNGHP